MSEKPKYFKNKFGCIFGDNILTPRFRLIYPHLRQRSDLSKKYQICCLFDPKDPKVKADLLKMQKVGKLLIQEAGKAGKGYKNPPLKNGNDNEKEEFHDKFYIQPSAKELPILVDVDNNALQPDAFSSGMICRAVVQPIFFPANGAGIAWTFSALRLVKDDGIRYYNGPDPKSLFEDDSEDEGDDVDEESDEDELEAAPATAKKAKKAKVEEVEEEELEEEEEEIDDDELEESDETEDSDELDEDDAPAPKKTATGAAGAKAAKPAGKVNGAAPAGKRGRPKKSTADQIMDVL
jgi:hypothetical protein